MPTTPIVPRNFGEGAIGTATKPFAVGNFNEVKVSSNPVAGKNGDITAEGKVSAGSINTTGDITAEGKVSAGSINTLQRNKTYETGNIAYSALLPSSMYLECIHGGTTGDVEPVLSTVGGQVDDGTVKWTIKTMTAKEYVDNKASEILLSAKEYTNAKTLNAVDLVDTSFWVSADESQWVYGEKYSNGDCVVRGVGLQQANVLGITLTYPWPLLAKITGVCTATAAIGTGYTALASFTYGSSTNGYFTVREANYTTPVYPVNICFEVRGRWK